MKIMSKLGAKQRDQLGNSEFGIPSERKYPLNDKSHAANAKARASEMANKGKISSSTEAKIDTKANKVLGKSEHGQKNVERVGERIGMGKNRGEIGRG
jgi:hypothetical protein